MANSQSKKKGSPALPVLTQRNVPALHSARTLTQAYMNKDGPCPLCSWLIQKKKKRRVNNVFCRLSQACTLSFSLEADTSFLLIFCFVSSFSPIRLCLFLAFLMDCWLTLVLMMHLNYELRGLVNCYLLLF